MSNHNSPPDPAMYPTLYGNHGGGHSRPSNTRIKVMARGTSIDMACQTDSSTNTNDTLSPVRLRPPSRHGVAGGGGGGGGMTVGGLGTFKRHKDMSEKKSQQFRCREAGRDIHLHGIRKLLDGHGNWIRRWV